MCDIYTYFVIFIPRYFISYSIVNGILNSFSSRSLIVYSISIYFLYVDLESYNCATLTNKI